MEKAQTDILPAPSQARAPARVAPDDRSGPTPRPSGEDGFTRLERDVVRPIVDRVARRHLRSDEVAHFRDDLGSEVALRVWRRLERALMEEEPPIENLEAYVTTTARAACIDLLRARAPRRTRLQYRLRYLERGDPSWNRVRLKNGDWVARRIEDAEPRPSGTREAERLRRAVESCLNEAGGQLPWSELVARVAEALGEIDDVGLSDRLVRCDAPEHVETLERRRFLEAAWKEIRELGPKQRAALLLNLRFAPGQDAVPLLLECSLTSEGELAQLLGVPLQELSRLLDELPLDDASIAHRLGLDRRQVVHQRLAARRKLTRRLEEFLR